MADLIVQVAIPYNTLIPEDVSVNTWSFQAETLDGTNLAQFADFITTFYTGIVQYLSPVLRTEAANITFFDRADPSPRTPIGTEVFDFTAGNTGDPLPEEAAVCLSFRGVLVSGQPPARRKGRVFLGPLSQNVVLTDPNQRSRVSTTAMNDICDAYADAYAELTTATNFHTVWSGMDSAAYPITHIWVDNAFDTQRRRGPITSARQSRDQPFTP